MNNLFKFRMKAFALIALLLVGVSSAFAQQKIAIINAGSSGSRLYVYEFADSKIVKFDSYTPETVLQLSTIANTANAANAANAAAQYIKTMTQLYSPTDPTDPIDLYILATAGMRTVDSTKADNIYKALKNVKPTGNYIIKDAKTISGRYEGLYAWIAANYDVLKDYKGNWGNLSNTKGILEIGGQSMQIAYKNNGSSSDYIKRNHALIYSKSYVKGGANAIRGHYKDSLMVDSKVKPINIYQKDVPDLSSVSGITFYGLGGTINGANKYKNATNFVEKVDLIGSIEPDYYYNTHYLRWVLGQLGLLVNGKIDAKDADWTKGAAYDIVVNDKADSIEAFNYSQTNPN